MHYPPETANIMLLARMIATVLQVSYQHCRLVSGLLLKYVWITHTFSSIYALVYKVFKNKECKGWKKHAYFETTNKDFFFPLCLTKSSVTSNKTVYKNEMNVIYLFLLPYFQASDSKLALETFNNFCHSVVNTKEQIAHKLLGPKFQVDWYHNYNLNDTMLHRILLRLKPGSH